MSAYRNSREHLFEELRRLDLVLNNLVASAQRARPDARRFNEFRGLFISEDEIDKLLAGPNGPPPEGAAQDDGETAKLQEAVERARRRCAELVKGAVGRGESLALERLARLFRLSGFDVDALLVCLAPTERQVRKLYAYLQNDVTRKAPTADLVLNSSAARSARTDARTRLTGTRRSSAPARALRRRRARRRVAAPARALLVDERVLTTCSAGPPDARRHRSQGRQAFGGLGRLLLRPPP